MRKVPPGGNSPPLGLSGKGRPGREGCYIFTHLWRCRLQRLGSDRKTNGNRWAGGSRQALWAHEKNRNNNNTFQSFISLRVTGKGFHWPEMREAWWFSTPPWCFSTTHREGVAASGKDGAGPDPSLLRLSSENHSRRSSPFPLRLAGGPDDCSLYNTNSYCRLWSILSGA